MDPLAPNTHQKHDISPGIAPSGLFWTVRIPDSWVSVDDDDLDDGARMRVDDLHLLDYGTLANSLGVARNVVRGSYDYLEKAGVVQREGRKGRTVRAKTSRKKSAGKGVKKAAKKR